MQRKKFLLVVTGMGLLILAGAGYLYSRDYHIRLTVQKRASQTYTHIQNPKFSFQYDASKFEVDTDEENRFGETYLVGLKSPYDARVGCDVRATFGQLDLDGDVDELGSKLAKQISQNADVFRHTSSKFVQIGGQKAIRLEITFNGPLNETMRMSQAFVPRDDRVFTLICGTTKGTYPFFAPQFKRFFESFQFTPS